MWLGAGIGTRSRLEEILIYGVAVAEKQLHQREDSVMNVISQTRKLFAAATAEREKYGQEILRLEGELFDIRNRIGEVGNSINVIEQSMCWSIWMLRPFRRHLSLLL